MSTQMIFFIGFFVFGIFIIGILLIPRESKEEKNDRIEADIMDYDGAGNFGRIPNREKKKF
jgi:hypothetical protein